jgi:hypothetical protein
MGVYLYRIAEVLGGQMAEGQGFESAFALFELRRDSLQSSGSSGMIDDRSEKLAEGQGFEPWIQVLARITA